MHGAAAGIRPSNDQSDENLPHHGSIHPCEFVVAAEGAGVFAQCSKAPDHSGLQSVETIVGIEATFPSEVANDPHLHERGSLTWHEHPSLGPIVLCASPLRFQGLDPLPNAAVATLGAHTEQVCLEMLGMTAQEVAQLRTNGTI